MLKTLLLMTLISIPCFAQGSWEVIQMEPSVLMMDLCFLPDGQHGWAAGYQYAGGVTMNSLVGTTDGGANWDRILLSDSTFSLQGVCFTTADSGWVVGGGGRIYATTDGGGSWAQQTSGTSRLLSKVCFINSSEGWITGAWNDGSSFLVLKTINGGATWQNLSFGSNCWSCNDIYFHDSLNGWIAARQSGAGLLPLIYHTTDGGSSWISQTVPVDGALESVDFAAANEGWIPCSGGEILHTTDGGTNWVIQEDTGSSHQSCIDCQDSSRIALASTGSTGSSLHVYVSSDGGETWATRYPPASGYTRGIQYVGDNIWIAVDPGKILRSADNGATWTVQQNIQLLNSIAWSDSLGGWIVGEGDGFRTSDGGATWVPDPSTPNGDKIIFVNDQNGWILHESSNSYIWRTTDGGSTWNQHFIGGGKWVVDMFFISPDSGWACGQDGTIRFTSNGGQNWSAQSSGTTSYLQTIFFVDANTGWVAGSSGYIAHTTNGGVNWVQQTPALGDYFCKSFFLNDQEGWLSTAAASNVRVHRTSNGGSEWQVIGQTSGYAAAEILMKDSDNGWLVTRSSAQGSPPNDGRGFIYITTDGGSSFDLEWSGIWPKQSISDIAAQTDISDELLWGCGQHNTILKYVPETGIKIETSTSPGGILLYAPEPNPFNSSAVIRYETTLGSDVRLDLFDVSGRLVNTLQNGWLDAGLHQTTLSAENLSPGMYFYRLQTDESVETEKCIVFR